MTATQTATDPLDAIASQARSVLAPLAEAIDRQGLYPAEYLRELGALGGFGAAIPTSNGGLGLDLAAQVGITTHIAAQCGSTAFVVWCQSSCAWYLLHSSNEPVRARYLEAVARGVVFSGTGMSNAVKHLAGIESIHLKAVRDDDDYLVSGTLPWVSNVGAGHLVIVAASVQDEGYAMFVTPCDAEGLELHDCPEFSGLEGTRTLNLRFKNVRVKPGQVLAHPSQFDDYMARIKPGFIIGQTGIGFGIVEASLKTIRESNASHGHVNIYLDDQGADLLDELNRLKSAVSPLAAATQTGPVPVLDVLKLRARTSELTLRAANSAVLHAGAKGYLMRHPAQRRLREAVFVAIVTPALKHLRKEIDVLEQARHVEAA